MHIPVLQKEVIEYLAPKTNENFVDCTIGGGGHARAILEKTGPSGKLLGIDSDAGQIAACKSEMGGFGSRMILINDSYINLKSIVEKNNFGSIKGILFDLGMSSWHLEESERGFSFLKDEILDMRYGAGEHKLTAAEIVNQWAESALEKILREYGEEKFSRKIAKSFVEGRRNEPIATTTQLVKMIERATPPYYRHQRIHCATRTFQALRIAVNDELNNINRALPQALEIMEPGGRLAVISFHSLEDRIIKNFFKDYPKENIKIITKKPVVPDEAETRENPRARSAKMRIAQKI